MTRRIFISSVQRELAAERKAVVDGVSANPQLARFFSTFDEHGRKVGQKNAKVGAKGKEVGQKTSEVGQKNAEVGAKGKKLGANPAEVGANGEEVRANFDSVMANYRKDFRETCFKVWQLLREDSSLTQRDIYPRLWLAYSSVQSAYNALQEVGLLRREGRGKGSNWIVVPEPSQPITKPHEPRTNARKPITKRRVSAKKGKATK